MRKTAVIATLLASLLVGGCGLIRADTNTEETFSREEFIENTSYSMDWDSQGSMYLEKVAEYHGGDLSDMIYTIRVTLNLVWRDMRPIEDVVLEELYDNDNISPYEFEAIMPSETAKEALNKVMLEKLDNSDGSTDYIEFYEETSITK